LTAKLRFPLSLRHERSAYTDIGRIATGSREGEAKCTCANASRASRCRSAR